MYKKASTKRDDVEWNFDFVLRRDPTDSCEDFHNIFAGAAKRINQLSLYQSATSVVAWKQEVALEDYEAGVTIPLDEIIGHFGISMPTKKPAAGPVNMIALGSGQASQERRIVQALIQQYSIQKMNLFLIDASRLMLNLGLLECQRVFAPHPIVKSWAVYQNFFELPQNKKFLQELARPGSINLITFLGFTFANLEKENELFKNTLNFFPSKTLFLVDIITPYAPSDNPEEIRKNDPQFAAKRPYAERAEHRWAIPFILHHPQVNTHKDIQFIPVLDNQTCVIEGSYTIEVKAKVGESYWTIQRFKRYDLRGIIETFKKESWSHLGTFPFKDPKLPSYDDRSIALLFQKD